MTSTETRGSWSDRLSPRNWSLAWKLVAVGLVPALLAIVLGVLRVADQAQAASELGTANRLLEVRAQVADTGTALRSERDRATLFLAERRTGDRAPLNDAAARTDAVVEKLRAEIGGVELAAPARAAQERADGGLTQLSVLRSGVFGTAPLLPSQVLQRYTTIIDRVDGFDRALLRETRTPEIAGLTDALTAVTAANEALSLQHTVLGVSLRTGVVTPDDRAAVGVTDGAYVTAFGDYQLALPATVTPTNFVTSESNAQRDGAKSAIILAPTAGPIPVTPAAWDETVARAEADVTRAGTDVLGALTAAGKAAEARSSNLAGVNSVLLMLGLLLAATIVALVARSLTRSLRVLRTSALDVAQRRLPQAVDSMRAGNTPDVTVEPVPLANRDEVGQVARAFDAVHGQALRLAADQAALQNNVSSMFVNLSRRSQGLVERQLQLIENLESNEQDPDQLSNLFQLDHLATRMRRNSENLLVLAGTDFAKRNVAPVPLVDVLRAAVSEIEHYQRILVQAPPPATIVGRATSDVVHLLAELLDNATNFSPPDSQVVMSSMRTADGSILVEIADRGVGMLDHELADANRRLNTPSAVDVSASRRMGLFVVGRLGARHGIVVHLGGERLGGGDGGLTASVTLPAHLVVSVGGEDVRPQREPAAAAALVNGVPPQRPARGGSSRVLPGPGGRTAPRPAPAAALDAGSPNGQPLVRPAGLNGLPTRTPGSALRRNPLGGPAAPPEPGRPDVAPTGFAGAPGGRSAELGAAPVEQDHDGYDDGGYDQAGYGRGDRDRDGAERDGADHDARGLDRNGFGGDGFGGDGFGGDAFDRDDTDRDGAEQEHAEADGDNRDAYDRDAYDQDAYDQDGYDQDGRRAGAGPDGTPVEGHPAQLDARSGGTAHPGGADEVDPPTAGFPAGGVAAVEHAEDDRDVDGDAVPSADEQADDEGAEAYAETEDAAADGRGLHDDAEPDARPAATGSADGDGSGAGTADPDGPVPLPVRNPSARLRPTGAVGPNGSYRRVPATPFAAAGTDGRANGAGPNGTGRDGTPDVFSPPTTPLPVVSEPPADRVPAAQGPDDPSEVLFSASVPAIAEPEGLPRSRRPLGALRRGGPADVTETTPIFEEIASAWFASQRPVPVDWERGQPTPAPDQAPAQAPDQAPAQATAQAPERAPRRDPGPAATRPPQPPPPPQPQQARRDLPATPARAAAAPAVEDSAFASAADEGWRAASGAAAERPDEVTAAGLPKRRPRARLVPGSAGSAVLAAPSSPSTRSADSIRGRLASYQQGVRQGREVRLRRDPGGAGQQPAADQDHATAPADGEHDENIR